MCTQPRVAKEFTENVESMMLMMCNLYANMLSLVILPNYVANLLGRTGFGPLATAYRILAKRFAEETYSFCCEKYDPVEFLRYAAAINQKAGNAFSLMPIEVNGTRDDLTVVFSLDKTILEEARGDLATVPLLGLVAGLYDYAGYQTYILSSKNALRPNKTNIYIVYVESINNNEITIRVKKT